MRVVLMGNARVRKCANALADLNTFHIAGMFIKYNDSWKCIYILTFSSCAPICNECTNGKCLAPDNCECDDGYSWDNSTSKCEPICAFGCVNGVCETPGVCKCLKGFEINHEQK